MKNFKFNVKLLSLTMTGIIFISGCSNKSYSSKSSNTSVNSGAISSEPINNDNSSISEIKNNSSNIEIHEEANSSEIVETSKTETTLESMEPEINNEQTNQKDSIVLQEVKNLKNNVEKLLQSDMVTDFKSDCKNVFITLVDFIFYDGEIKGITFDELSDECKQEILKEVTTIDNLIMKKFPNYKEDISSTVSKAYNKASEIIKNGSENIKNFAKDKLGEENYNEIKEFKDKVKESATNVWDDIKDDTGELYEKAKDKVKNWYENLKN